MFSRSKRDEFIRRSKLLGEPGARSFLDNVVIDDYLWYEKAVRRCAIFSHTIRIAAFVASIATTVLAALMRSNSADVGGTQVNATYLVICGVATSISSVLLAPSNQLWQLRSEGKRMTRAVYEEALSRLRTCTNDAHWDSLHTWMRLREAAITDRQANSFFTILSTGFRPTAASTDDPSQKANGADHGHDHRETDPGR